MINKSQRCIASATRILNDEGGGAYTLSYVMVIPILMLLTCVVVETTLMMSAKVGTSYAAFAGARTAIVWSSASDWPTAKEKVEQAAIQSFAPFASGMGAQGSPPNEASAYAKSYTEFVNSPVSESYIKAKYANAAKRLKVTVDGPPSSYDSEIRVTVEYRFRFNIPGIGKLIGEPDGDGYSFPLSSTATLQNEGPKNDRQTLGIGYGKLE